MRNLFSLESLSYALAWDKFSFRICRVQAEWCLSQILTWIKGNEVFLFENVDPLLADRLKVFVLQKYEMRLWYMQRHVKRRFKFALNLSHRLPDPIDMRLVKLLPREVYHGPKEIVFDDSYSLTRLTRFSSLAKKLQNIESNIKWIANELQSV